MYRRRTVKSFASALLAVAACAGSLAAQNPPRRLLPILSSGDTSLSLDSASIHRTGDSTFLVPAVYQTPPDPAHHGADRREEGQEVNCPRAWIRRRSTTFYAGSGTEPAEPRVAPTPVSPEGWDRVGDAELPGFQAICAYLTGGWPARLALMVEEQPRLVNAPAVARALVREYPPELRQMGATGTVTLRFRVRADGTVERETMEVVSATDRRFAEAARRVALSMRFRPARLDHQPVAVWVSLPVNFYEVDPQRPAPGVPNTP